MANPFYHLRSLISPVIRIMFGINGSNNMPARADHAQLCAGAKMDDKLLSKALQGFKNKDKVLSFIIAINADDQVDELQLRPMCLIFDRGYNYLYLCFSPASSSSHCIIKDYIAMYLDNVNTNYQDGNLFVYESRLRIP